MVWNIIYKALQDLKRSPSYWFMGSIIALFVISIRAFINDGGAITFSLLKVCIIGIIHTFGESLLISFIIHDGGFRERVILSVSQIYQLIGQIFVISVVAYVVVGILMVFLPFYLADASFPGWVYVIIALAWLCVLVIFGLWFPWALQYIVREETDAWSAVTGGYWVMRHHFKVAVLLMVMALVMEGGVELLWGVISNSYISGTILISLFLWAIYLIVAGGKEAFTWLLYVHAWSFLQSE